MSLSRGRRRAPWLAVALLAALSSGCGGSEEAPTPAQRTAAPAGQRAAAPTPDVAVTPPPAARPAPAPAPRKAEPGEELVVELPADVPRYPGSRAVSMDRNDKEALSVGFASDDPPRTVADRYFADLRMNDWVINETPDDTGIALWAEKGSRLLTVMVTPEGKGSSIALLQLTMPSEVLEP